MAPVQLEKLKELARERVHPHYPLGQKSTFEAGGSVEVLVEVETIELLRDLVGFLRSESMPYFVIGRGSNILVRDEGVNGVAIFLGGEFEKIVSQKNSANKLWVGAGVSLFDLLLYCRDQGLAGLEFLAGIPGKVGGAVCMNAGAFGGEIHERIMAVELMGKDGSIRRIEKEDLSFGYRHFKKKEGSVVTRVLVSLEQDNSEQVRQRIVRYLIEKKKRQPLDMPSAGSVFKNPSGLHAGKLIEEVGLKGKAVGGAMISEKHANFIVNIGGARARDILALMELAQEKVEKRLGIELEPEIEVLG